VNRPSATMSIATRRVNHLDPDVSLSLGSLVDPSGLTFHSSSTASSLTRVKVP